MRTGKSATKEAGLDMVFKNYRPVSKLCWNALNWFDFYTTQRSQQASIHGTLSNHFDCGAPQGSCLWTLTICSLWVSTIKYHRKTSSSYALFCWWCVIVSSLTMWWVRLNWAIRAMNGCFSDLRIWLISDRLTINDDKTELF